MHDTLHVRWALRRDLSRLAEIDRESFAEAWSEESIQAKLRERHTVCLVAERDRQVVGFTIYTLHKRLVALGRLAVDPRHRRTGIATTLIGKLQARMSAARPLLVVSLLARETDLMDRFRTWGFRAYGLSRGTDPAGEADSVRETTDDIWTFSYTWKPADA